MRRAISELGINAKGKVIPVFSFSTVSVGGSTFSFEPFFFLKSFFFFNILLIHERERQRPRQREKQVPCREPDAGLDPRTPGSHPEPKAELNH